MDENPPKRAREESDHPFRLLVDSVADYAIFMLDPSGIVTTWNRGAQRLKGYEAHEIIGQHFSRFYSEEDIRAGKTQMELEVAARVGRFEDEGWRVRKDGSRFWANVVITAMRTPGNGTLLGFAKVTRDLTERKRADEELRQSEELFRLLVDSVGDYAIFMLDPQGIVTTWNRGAERIKGYSAEEIVGQHFSRFYTQEDVRAGKTQMELETAARVGRFEDEDWRVRKDGSRIWANVIITPVRDPKTGTLRGFSKVTRDLTERKRAEQERVDLAKAREAVRLRDEFISIASHELRTPLSTLRLQADSLARALDRGTMAPERISGKVHTVGAQVTRLERLVTSLLDVSRIEGGHLKLELEVVDLSALVRDVAAALSDELDRTHCVLVLHADKPIVGSWDRGRIDQVLTNLLTNAAKYGPGKPIEVSVRDGQEVATVAVRDQGIGIAPEDHARIFDRYERAVDARHFGGLGLGLWLTNALVTAHGGTVAVASEPGAGATFTVTLPKGTSK